MKDFTLDSVAVNTIATPAALVNNSTPLDRLLRSGVKIRVDPNQDIMSEWQKCCGSETVKQLIIHWSQWGGIVPVRRLAKIGPTLMKKLRRLGFRDTGDKLLIRIAVATTDRRLVSSDADFWDPALPAKMCIGVSNSPVCRLLRDELRIEVLTLKSLLAYDR